MAAVSLGALLVSVIDDDGRRTLAADLVHRPHHRGQRAVPRTRCRGLTDRMVLLEGGRLRPSRTARISRSHPSQRGEIRDDAEHHLRERLVTSLLSEEGLRRRTAGAVAAGRVIALTEFPAVGWSWRPPHQVSETAPATTLRLLSEVRISFRTRARGPRRVMVKMTFSAGRRLRSVDRGGQAQWRLVAGKTRGQVSLVFLPALHGGSRTPELFRCADLGMSDWPTRLETAVDGERTDRTCPPALSSCSRRERRSLASESSPPFVGGEFCSGSVRHAGKHVIVVSIIVGPLLAGCSRPVVGCGRPECRRGGVCRVRCAAQSEAQ